MGNILFVQLLVFAVAALATLIYTVFLLLRRARGSTRGITKIIMLSAENEMMDSFSLANRTSALISAGGAVDVGLENDLPVDGYAVANRVGSDWYVERISDERSIAIKRAGDQYVYKMKANLSYRLYANDILYVGDERLLVL
jgi:hypothetical protein